MLFLPHNILKFVIFNIVVRVMKMTKKIIGLSIDQVILNKIDQKRGMIPRSRFLEKIISENMGD